VRCFLQMGLVANSRDVMALNVENFRNIGGAKSNGSIRLRKFPEENYLAVPVILIAPCITPQQGSNILSCHSSRCEGSNTSRGRAATLGGIRGGRFAPKKCFDGL
jgi:hypothetical protein